MLSRGISCAFCAALLAFTIFPQVGAAATYRISVDAILSRLSFDGLEFCPSRPATSSDCTRFANYVISGPSDPVLENFNTSPFVDGLLSSAFSETGKLILRENLDPSCIPDCYDVLEATGVFNFGWRTAGRVVDFEIRELGIWYSRGFGSGVRTLSTADMLILSANDDDGVRWTNTLGTFTWTNGYFLRHEILDYEVSKIPLPPTLAMALVGLGAMGFLSRRKRGKVTNAGGASAI